MKKAQLYFLSNQYYKDFPDDKLMQNKELIAGQAMRQFYRIFKIPHTLCAELSWSHYRLLMKIEDESRREFYARECVEATWSVRQLERQIN